MKERLRGILVGIVEREISTQQRKYDRHQLVVLQHRRRDAVEAAHFRQKFLCRQSMNVRVSAKDLRRTSSGHEQANGTHTVLPAQLAREFETNQRSQTVPEDGKGLVQQ